jgi:hypothetical protein
MPTRQVSDRDARDIDMRGHLVIVSVRDFHDALLQT